MKMEMIDIPGDPYFLAKYRSFHNHDLDANYVENAHLVMEQEDLPKKGSASSVSMCCTVALWLEKKRDPRRR